MAKAAVDTRQRRPDVRWEREAWSAGKTTVAGVDEAGRGAWAGPLVAAAVILPRASVARARLTRALSRAGTLANDSKLLTADKRERVMHVLHDLNVPFAVACVESAEIDCIGLGPANRAAMCRAVSSLDPSPDHVLVDAFRLPELQCSHLPIVHGDALSVSIALASIVAKLHRDALMQQLDLVHEGYGFSSHKGYGTPAHQIALQKRGVSPIHRRSFAPIAKLLERDATG
jgi:ribonuclease HII